MIQKMVDHDLPMPERACEYARLLNFYPFCIYLGSAPPKENKHDLDIQGVAVSIEPSRLMFKDMRT